MENATLWIADPCADARGFATIRLADGSPCGDTEAQPVATVFRADAVPLIVAAGPMRAALTIAERFMAGFEGDEMQEGIDGMLSTVRGALALAGGAVPVAQTPAPALANLAAISTAYDDARQALADAEDDDADDVAKAGMDDAAISGFDLARAALDALATMRAAYAPLHDKLSALVEDASEADAMIVPEAERAALADLLATCCDADAHASRVLAGQDAPAAPQTPASQDDADATPDHVKADPIAPTTDEIGRYIGDMLDDGDVDGSAGGEPDHIADIDNRDPSNLRLHMASGALFVVRIIREG